MTAVEVKSRGLASLEHMDGRVQIIFFNNIFFPNGGMENVLCMYTEWGREKSCFSYWKMIGMRTYAKIFSSFVEKTIILFVDSYFHLKQFPWTINF